MIGTPVYVELLDDNHEVLYANVYHSIIWAKQCIKELEIKYRYIRVTFKARANGKNKTFRSTYGL